MFADRIRSRLALQQQSGLYRNPPAIRQREGKYLHIGDRRVLNFSSNDYLGLSVSADLAACAARNFERYGASSSSSRLVSGHYDAISQAEAAYAAYFGYENAVFFPSGYQANVALISTFFEPGDQVFYDKHIHASTVKGMALSRADFFGYNHSDMAHLEKRMKAKGGEATVLTESLFSMDGDCLDASRFRPLKERYGFGLIVDEAHAFGVLGDGGRGLATGLADIAVGTFGKALGFFGAFILLPSLAKDYLFNFASPLIYTTALPEAHAATALDILNLVAKADDRRRHLAHLSAAFADTLRRDGFRVSGEAHILAVEIGDEGKTAALSRYLLENDIFVLPARYPTVPLNRAILRISLTALHDDDDIRRFAAALKEGYERLETVA